MKKILGIFLLVAATVGCKKNDETPTELAKTAANLAGTYLLVDETETLNGVTTNTYNDYLACEKDDTHVYTAAGNITITDAGTRCTPPTPTQNVTYTITGDQMTVMGQNATIESLTSANLTLSTSYSFMGTTIKIKQVYLRQ